MDTNINGNRVSWADFVFSKPDGTDVPSGAMKSFNWQSSQEPGNIQGNAVYSAGKTAGFFVASADFEMLMNEASDWEDDLTNSGDTKLYRTDFDMSASYINEDETEKHTVTLRGCRVKSRTVSAANSTDPICNKYEMVVQRVTFDGRDD